MTILELNKYLEEIGQMIDFDDARTEITVSSVSCDPHMSKMLLLKIELGDYFITVRKMFKGDDK